jgi:hypothetical protein
LKNVDEIWKKVMLKGVIYIPHLTRNLFLVKQATTQGVVTFFDEDFFIMIDKNANGATMMDGWMDGHLDGKCTN